MGRYTSHYRGGIAWANHGEHERAIAAFRRDLEGATTSLARVEDHVAIAQVEAIAALEARPPGDQWCWGPHAQLRIAELWLEESEPERARAAYEAALGNCEEELPQGYVAHFARLGLVRVLLAKGRPQDALEALDGLPYTHDSAEA